MFFSMVGLMAISYTNIGKNAVCILDSICDRHSNSGFSMCASIARFEALEYLRNLLSMDHDRIEICFFAEQLSSAYNA